MIIKDAALKYLANLINISGYEKLLVKSLHKNPRFAESHMFPLSTALLALNLTHIDYFSLDVEGAELRVLRVLSI